MKYFRPVKMKPWLILLIWATVLIVLAGAQSHRFSAPVRRRRIERIEPTIAEEGNTEDKNNASANKELEVKRRIDLMKGSAGRNEPGTNIASKTDKQNSKTKNTPVTGRGVATHRGNGVGQTRGKQVSNRQHQVQKIRSRGRQIQSRVGETEKKGRNKRPLKIKASRETSD